jgi:hypothetical protein
VKSVIYLLSGIVGGIGLSLSGMIDPAKVKSFFAIGVPGWSPALLIVVASAIPVYLLSFLILRRREKTINGTKFNHPKPRPIERNLVIGAVLFGMGWGIAGTCPGPAIIHLSFLDMNFSDFLAAMFVGFELHRRFI